MRPHTLGPRHVPIPRPRTRCDDCGATAPAFYGWVGRLLCPTCLAVRWVRWLASMEAPEAAELWRRYAADNLARIRAALAG
jgi:hypothetical protein